MSAVRLNITLPIELIERVDGIIGPRKRSQFITDALKRRLDEMDQEKLRQAMEEGYKARKEESASMAKEFECSDLEGWDEY